MPDAVDRWAAARACYGVALCAAPAALIRLTGPPGSRGTGAGGAAAPGRRTRDVVRILGARHLAQAAVSVRWPTRRILAASAATDVAHAASMIALAVLDQRRRRVAIIDALVATTFAAAGIAAAGRSSAADPATGPADLPS
jgi:hypothetical protein